MSQDSTTTYKAVPTTEYIVGKPYLKREVGYSGQMEYRVIVLSAIVPELSQALYFAGATSYAQSEDTAAKEFASESYQTVAFKDLYIGVAITRGDKLNEI